MVSLLFLELYIQSFVVLAICVNTPSTFIFTSTSKFNKTPAFLFQTLYLVRVGFYCDLQLLQVGCPQFTL